MNKRTSLSLAVLAALGMLTLPLAVHAAPTTAELAEEGGTIKEIGVGAGLLSDDSFRLGRFTGITEEGLFPDLSFDVLTRSAYTDEKPYLWRIEGDNLGLDSQSLSISGGSQGRYSAFIYYREMPNLIQPDAGTPYRGLGSNRLTLPPDGGFASLEDNLRDVDIETKRQRVGLGGRLNITPRWRTSTALHHEHKEGNKIRGIGDNWGLERATVVPAPVDYDTTRFEADVTYDGPRLQSRLGYMVSVFSQSNKGSFLAADAHALDWSGAEFMRQVLEPNNNFQQLSGNLGLSLGQYTRLGADVQVGVMRQDAKFIDDQAVVRNADGDVQDSLDGQIDTKVINLRASTRLFDRLSLRADYRFDDRDNKTPELVVDRGEPLLDPARGFQCGIAAGVAATECVTRPVSFEQERISGEAELRLAGRSFLTLGYTNDERERTYEDREKTEEETYEARLRSRWSQAMVMLNYAVAEQRGSNWERETLPVELRKYYLADRDRTRAGVHLSYMPTARVQTTLRSEMVNDDYIASELGLTESQRMIHSWDIAWFPTDRLQTYAFYSFENRTYDQAGFDADAGVAWTADREDQTFTVGVGGEYVLIPNKLKLGIEGMLVQTVGKMDVVPAVGASNAYPDLESNLGLFSLYGDWRLSRNMDVRVRYMMETYDEKDWGVDDVGVTDVADLILLDRESPDYTAHLIAATVRYRF
ncbi:MAG: MtrB/PioB family decaheme-associated outer membrane protein [Thiohalomonadaceae bacterium]